jgi:hypothetical protein
VFSLTVHKAYIVHPIVVPNTTVARGYSFAIQYNTSMEYDEELQQIDKFHRYIIPMVYQLQQVIGKGNLLLICRNLLQSPVSWETNSTATFEVKLKEFPHPELVAVDGKLL